MRKHLTEDEIKEINNLAETYWKYIVASFSPNNKYISNIMPSIEIKRKKHLAGITYWNDEEEILGMNITNHHIELFLTKNKPNLKIKQTIIHELIHARGYNHGYIQKLKFSSHSGDELSKIVLKGIMILEKDKNLQETTINANGSVYKNNNFGFLTYTNTSNLIGKRTSITIKR